jgi:Ala-tRNA(Pro) deacylase
MCIEMSDVQHHGEKELFEFFQELGIDTTTHRHEALHTVEQSQELRGDLPGGHCKSLFLKDKKAQLWLVVALEDSEVNLKKLHKQIGAARLSFGNSDLMWQVLGVRPGSVTPFALINDQQKQVNIVLDQAMLAHDLLNYHPLHNEATTAIATTDLRRFIKATGHQMQETDLTVVPE